MTTPSTKPVPSSLAQDLLFNAERMDEAINSALLNYIDRLGVERLTLAGAVDTIKAVNTRGAWAATTSYALKDVVTNGGVSYICVLAHISGATFAGDLATYWRVYQGVLSTDLSSTSDATKAAGQMAYNAALAYAAGTVGFELNKRKSVFGTGVAATDVANFNAAIAAAPANTIVELFGNFTFGAQLNLKPQIWIKGNGAKITCTNNAVDYFSYTPGSPTGFPGGILIENFEAVGPGNSGTANLINIDANAPFILLKSIYAGGFFRFVNLRDCYNTIIDQCRFYTCTHGVSLRRECHSFTWINSLVDAATVAAFSINYGGGAGTGTCHNVNLLGGALQNSAVGLWAENCLELHTVGLYHEGNTVNDYRIGVNDGGAYARACYNVVIDGFSSSSPCGSDRNIRIEHTVGWQVRGAAWNTGCSTTATLLSYDGFSSRGLVDIFRHTTAVPTATAPVDCTVDPTRAVVVYANRKIYGAGVADAIGAGTLASKLWTLGHQNFSGRDAALLKSSLDVVLQVGSGGVLKVRDSAGNDQFAISVPMASSAPGAGSKMLWYDPADGNRVKFQP